MSPSHHHHLQPPHFPPPNPLRYPPPHNSLPQHIGAASFALFARCSSCSRLSSPPSNTFFFFFLPPHPLPPPPSKLAASASAPTDLLALQYCEAKRAARSYQAAKQQWFRSLQEAGLGCWVTKPAEQEHFLLAA